MLETNKLIVTDEDGTTTEMEILFTFEDEEHGKNYVLFTDPKSEDGQVFASVYTEEGTMDPVETEEEWKMIEEVFNAFEEGLDHE